MTDFVQRWYDAIARAHPNLPRPVAEAMAQSAAKGGLGPALCQITEGLAQLENFSPDNLTGSEVRALLAILSDLSVQEERLRTRLLSLWQD